MNARTLVIATMLAGLIGCNKKSPTTSAPPPAQAAPAVIEPSKVEPPAVAVPAKKVMDREEFKKTFWYGKANKREDIMAVFGKPARTSEQVIRGRGPVAWYVFEGITVDGITGKVDTKTVVELDGYEFKVRDVQFVP